MPKRAGYDRLGKMKKTDTEIDQLIKEEEKRQKEGLVLIPSENYTSPAVMAALGSILTNKYSEGYPGKRYYSGNQFIDEIETIAQERAKKLFNVVHANVQPYSGSPANQAVYFALCLPGETVMGMSLAEGGHLTHGHQVNFSGKIYRSVQYGVDPKTGLIDYEKVRQLAKKEQPKLIWTGATAYPRLFDWQKSARVCDEVGAYHVADIAHYAGLIVGGAYPSPAPFAHIITTTTHKTLRGPRGAMIMVTRKGLEKDPDLPKKIDRAVFPGLQGGPHDHQTAAIAVCLKEASTPAFRRYAQQVVRNAQVLAEELKKLGFELVSGGTDNHLMLIDLTNKGISGSQAQDALEQAGIFVNKNTVPGEKRTPFDPSGIRLGTPAVTTRGMKEAQMRMIATWIDRVIENIKNKKEIKMIKKEVKKFCLHFPIWP